MERKLNFLVLWVGLATYLFFNLGCANEFSEEAKKYSIKGFYLTMSEGEVKRNIKKYPDIFKTTKEFSVASVLTIGAETKDKGPMMFLLSNDKVFFILVSKLAINQIFNISEMSVEDFVKFIMNKYKITKMDLVDDVINGQTRKVYKYTTPKGIAIKINQEKTLTMELPRGWKK
jgi:hypothetical protein